MFFNGDGVNGDVVADAASLSWSLVLRGHGGVAVSEWTEAQAIADL